jgi:hypothetical protein
MMPVMCVNGCPLLCSIIATADKAVMGHSFTIITDAATDVDQRVPVVHQKGYCCYHGPRYSMGTVMGLGLIICLCVQNISDNSSHVSGCPLSYSITAAAAIAGFQSPMERLLLLLPPLERLQVYCPIMLTVPGSISYLLQ